MGLEAKFAGFLQHHAADLHKLASVLEGIFFALPIQSDEKGGLLDAVKTLRTSATNIETSIPSLVTDAEGAASSVSKDDVINAVKESVEDNLPSLIETGLDAVVARAVSKHLEGVNNQTDLQRTGVVDPTTGASEQAAGKAAKTGAAKANNSGENGGETTGATVTETV